MPAKSALIPNERLDLKLDPRLLTRLRLELWSTVEGRVPKGEYKAFFEERLREYFSKKDAFLAVMRSQDGRDDTLDIEGA